MERIRHLFGEFMWIDRIKDVVNHKGVVRSKLDRMQMEAKETYVDCLSKMVDGALTMESYNDRWSWVVENQAGYVVNPSNGIVYGTSDDDSKGPRIRHTQNKQCMIDRILEVKTGARTKYLQILLQRKFSSFAITVYC